jgi:hypothetical protein
LEEGGFGEGEVVGSVNFGFVLTTPSTLVRDGKPSLTKSLLGAFVVIFIPLF